jgi:hypothetical protein
MTEASVIRLPPTGLAPDNACVAEELRRLAEWIEDGDFDEVITVIAVIEDGEGQIHRQTIGRPCDRARAVGLLTFASNLAMTDD